MRSYKQQFEPAVAERIEEVIRQLENIRYPTGSARYYGHDLALCLGAGAIAGSLVVASALMELYVRGLVVRYVEKAQFGWARKVDVEVELDKMRSENFYSLVDRLVEAELFLASDAQSAKDIYREVRIPTHHGLPTRLLRRPEDHLVRDIKHASRGVSTVSMIDFEDFFEREGLSVIEKIVAILRGNEVKGKA